MSRCECGCQRETAKATHRFIHGHNRRGVSLSAETKAKVTGRPITDTTATSAVHQWLTKHHLKAGRCDECRKVGPTDWAYLNHPNPHTRNRNDYLELCRKCHRKMDDPIYQWSEQIKTIKTTESCRAGQRAAVASRMANKGVV